VSQPSGHFDELRPLLIRLVDDRLDEADRARLVELLRDDPAARSFYLQYMLTDAMLRLEHSTPLLGLTGEREQDDEQTSTECGMMNDELAANDSLSVHPLPVILDHSNSPLSILSGFVGGATLCYWIAVALLGSGMLAAWVFRAGDRSLEIAATTALLPSRPAIGVPGEKQAVVGRITQTLKCEWADNENRGAEGAAVRVGGKYGLNSGLLEITYDVGARVVIEGPAAYEVDAPDGGILWLGKLNARVDNHAKTGHHPGRVFVIRIHGREGVTSFVCGCGAELNMRADPKQGALHGSVARGRVTLQLPDWKELEMVPWKGEDGTVDAGFDAKQRLRVAVGDLEPAPGQKQLSPKQATAADGKKRAIGSEPQKGDGHMNGT
jgi:hypothetical protein